MKIYLYCTETGIYQGEDFADEAAMRRRGNAAAGTTTTAPPRYQRGQVPVYVLKEGRWELRTVSGRDSALRKGNRGGSAERIPAAGVTGATAGAPTAR